MSTPLVSVLTPTIAGRESFLEECLHSVESQTTDVKVEQLVGIDQERAGCSVTMNRLAARARGAWLIPLADDDLMLPGAIRTLTETQKLSDADIVYSPPLVWGNGETHFFGEPPCIPSFALIRTKLWRDLGGYDEERKREEDRNLWRAAMDAGAVFVRASDAPTWVYRFHGGNKSYHRGVAR